jgi:DNA-binding PucR family transcriptional regulator
MSSLTGALQELRAERKQAQAHVEKLDQAILVIESINGTGTSRKTKQPTRVISAASRRKMAHAQQARWAKVRKESQPAAAVAKTTDSAPVKHTMSASARRKVAAAQRARWAKVKAGQKKAA